MHFGKTTITSLGTIMMLECLTHQHVCQHPTLELEGSISPRLEKIERDFIGAGGSIDGELELDPVIAQILSLFAYFGIIINYP